MLSVGDSYSHPLHQRWEKHEGSVWTRKKGIVINISLISAPEIQWHASLLPGPAWRRQKQVKPILQRQTVPLLGRSQQVKDLELLSPGYLNCFLSQTGSCQDMPALCSTLRPAGSRPVPNTSSLLLLVAGLSSPSPSGQCVILDQKCCHLTCVPPIVFVPVPHNPNAQAAPPLIWYPWFLKNMVDYFNFNWTRLFQCSLPWSLLYCHYPVAFHILHFLHAELQPLFLHN